MLYTQIPSRFNSQITVGVPVDDSENCLNIALQFDDAGICLNCDSIDTATQQLISALGVEVVWIDENNVDGNDVATSESNSTPEGNGDGGNEPQPVVVSQDVELFADLQNLTVKQLRAMADQAGIDPKLYAKPTFTKAQLIDLIVTCVR